MARRPVLVGPAVLMITCAARAEEQGLEKYIDLLKQDIRTAKVAAITEYLPMTDGKAKEIFSP